MTDFRDPFPELSLTVDVGGDRYYLGSEKPVDLLYKSRADFINAFGKDAHTEYLLRKYLFNVVNDKAVRKFIFDDGKERDDLIKILKKRATNLKASQEFSSSTLKNIQFQRIYIEIQRIIQQLLGPEDKGWDILSKLPSIGFSKKCTANKKYVKEIPQDRLFQLLLEMSWYLLHPDEVPEKVRCDWASAVKQLDLLRLGDVVAQIKGDADKAGVDLEGQTPFNYFKKINVGKVASATSKQNALDDAKEMVLQIKADIAKNDMETRLKNILEVLEMKKYLDTPASFDPSKASIIDVPLDTKKLEKSLIKNPMRGGGQALEKPLGVAMGPIFDYFRVSYDPIYSFIEGKIKSADAAQDVKVLLPELLVLLHIANNLKPNEAANAAVGGEYTYGVFHIKNTDPDLRKFVNYMLGQTRSYVGAFTDEQSKITFSQQLLQLPKVRLSSLLNKFANSAAYKDPSTIPYVRFFTVGGNLNLPTKDEFLDFDLPSQSDALEEMYEALTSLFNENDIYIVCTKDGNLNEDIPMNVYEIDYNKVDVGETGVIVDTPVDNWFNKNKSKDNPLYLEKLVKLDEYVDYNNGELALSILASLKELMPK